MSILPRLLSSKCVSCQGGIPVITGEALEPFLSAIPKWKVLENPPRLRRDWKLKNFMSGVHFINQIAEIAEKEQHHPDFEMKGYQNFSIEIFTHSVGGLTENDFILAAKIDQLPVELSKHHKD
eukprot:TRINITY_DN2912_c0_g1_i2.p1 TRINITY_DN2912_c0_g1~~TRINITY_DN2912_c0_g1_i2.p1  ORF type:complete len:141 (-),score=37.58 TRINITY_DN2912_c0_g1_i2:166-534(-)